MCTVAGTKRKLFIDGSLSTLNQTRINRRNQRKNGKIMKSCGYYAMGQHLSASIQKHKSTTNQRKTGKIMKIILWILRHGQTLVCFKPKTQKHSTSTQKRKIMQSCGYYGMGQHLLLKEKVIKWLRRAYLVGDHFLYCHDVSVWFRDDSVRRN